MTTMRSQHPRADHRPYVETVRATLLLGDIHVGVPIFTTTQVRTAAMSLLAPDKDFDEPWHDTFATAEHVDLRWDEHAGWSLQALHADSAALLPCIWRPGFDVVTPPDEVSAWLAPLMTMPSRPTSREHGPHLPHYQHNPALETDLSAYAP